MTRMASETALKAQIAKLQARLKKASKGREKIILAVVKKIQTNGISLDELKAAMGGKTPIKAGKRGKRPSRLKGKKAPIKYRDKNGNKWAGRGLAPRWIIAAEKAGMKRDQFLVKR